MSKTDLNKYACKWPFMYTEVYDGDRQYSCCPNLMGINIAEEGDFTKDWFGPKAVAARQAVLDGSFRFCNKEQCSHLHNVLEKDEPSGPVVTKEEFYKEEYGTPKWINFSFDFSCNLSCPSCRASIINASPKKILEIDDRMAKLEYGYSKEAEELHITSTGDPFYSKTYRDYLINFDSSKYPNLQKIHLHTNGTLWNKEMWNKMAGIHKYVKSAHISIDAASKEVYEVVRRNGKWEMLQNNLKYLSEEVVSNFEFVICSMVVQKDNYKEMEDFVDMIWDYFGKKGHVHLFKIIRLPFMTDEYWNDQYIYDEKHPEHKDYLKEIEKIKSIPHVNQNLT